MSAKSTPHILSLNCEYTSVLQIAVDHRLLPNVYESCSVKRNWKFVKMTEQNLPIAEIFYSLQFLILLVTSTISSLVYFTHEPSLYAHFSLDGLHSEEVK